MLSNYMVFFTRAHGFLINHAKKPMVLLPSTDDMSLLEAMVYNKPGPYKGFCQGGF